MYLICSHAQQLIQQIENTLFFKLNSGFVLIQTGENDAAVEEHNTGTIRRRRPGIALESPWNRPRAAQDPCRSAPDQRTPTARIVLGAPAPYLRVWNFMNKRERPMRLQIEYCQR
jgi:hypothetical protein